MNGGRILALAIAIVLVALTGLGCDTKTMTAELILHNGKVVSLATDGAGASAIAIRQGRIIYVGEDDRALSYATPQTRVIDLEARVVVPGFTDNHFHSIGGGPGVDLSQTRSVEDVIEQIRARAEKASAGDIIRTNSDWHEGQLREQRLPLRDDLDLASQVHPVVVVRGGHELILNSAALSHWKIDERTEAPVGGSIGRYPDGRLNGELVDHAKDLVSLALATPSGAIAPEDEEQELAKLEAQHDRLNEAGLTSIRYAGGGREMFDRLRELRRQNRLTIRVDYLFRLANSTPLDEIAKVVDSWGISPGEGDDWLRVAGIKLGVDGGFEGGWMQQPYVDSLGHEGDYYGLQTFPSERFVETVSLLHQMGYRIATHAVGDAAIDLVLEAYENANRLDPARPITERRFTIEHGFVVRQEQLQRIQRLGLHISAQHHLYVAAPSLSKYWGRERAELVTPVKTYAEAGIPVSLGTDAPVIPYPPLAVLYHFITRDTLSAGVMGGAQRLERERALSMMSQGYAALTFDEEHSGSLEVGKRADMVVLEKDILTCAPEDIASMAIETTIVDGAIVYSRASR